MNFDVKFDSQAERFSAQFSEDDSSFEGFGKDLQLIHGKDGASAYEIAVANGFEGTEAEWLESLHGKDGQDGDYIPAPATAQIGQTIVVKAVDENGKPTEWEAADVPEQVQGDWNQNDESQPDYVKNRTHWVETFEPVEWDGSTEGRDSFDASAMGLGVFYKISDEVWTKQECEEASYKKTVNGYFAGEGFGETVLYDETIGYGFSAASGTYFLSAFTAADLTAVYGFAIPSAGLYCYQPNLGEDGYDVTTYLLEATKKDKFHPIDENFIPSTVLRVGGSGITVPVYPVTINEGVEFEVDGRAMDDTNFYTEETITEDFVSKVERAHLFSITVLFHDASDEYTISFARTHAENHSHPHQGTQLVTLSNGSVVVVHVEFGITPDSSFRMWAKSLPLG